MIQPLALMAAARNCCTATEVPCGSTKSHAGLPVAATPQQRPHQDLEDSGCCDDPAVTVWLPEAAHATWLAQHRHGALSYTTAKPTPTRSNVVPAQLVQLCAVTAAAPGFSHAAALSSCSPVAPQALHHSHTLNILHPHAPDHTHQL